MQRAATHYELVVPPEVRRKARRRWRLWATMGSTIAVVALVLAALRPWRRAAPAFRTAAVERRTIIETVEATGHLDVARRIEVPSPAAGTLVALLAKEGETVKRGQPLARLDARAAAIELSAARAALDSAKSRLAQARSVRAAADDDLARTLRLEARGLASDSEVVAARLARAKARAGLATASAEQKVSVEHLAQAELADEQRTLSAPVDGVVLSAPESLGAIVTPQQGPLFVIGNQLGSLRIEAWVSEADIGDVKVGQLATFTVPAYPDRRFSARVLRVGVDARTQGASVRYRVLLAANNDRRRLLPGMTVTLRIDVARADHVLAVREAALRFMPNETPSNRSRVWRLTGSGSLKPVRVTAGVSDGAYTEVRPERGQVLRAGDAIVIGRALPTTERGPGISLGGGRR